MSADRVPVVLAEMATGFRYFLVGVALIVVLGAVLAFMARFAGPQVARGARIANRYVLLTIVAVIVVFPIYITVVNSLLRPDVIAARPPTLFPKDPSFTAYANAWTDGHLGRYLFNSFLVTFLIVIGQVATSILAGYAFAFLRFPLKRTIFVLFLATMMVPFEVTFLTNIETVDWFENIPVIGQYITLNTYGALVIPFLATGFGAFLVRQSFMSLPRDLRDAAALDGYGHWRFMLRVAVPLSRPVIAALSLFAFFGAFNQYLWPLLVTEDDQLRTVQIGLKQLQAVNVDKINETFAGAVLAALPLFVLLFFFGKQLVRGLTAGAVKG